jgi:hypothetical protein
MGLMLYSMISSVMGPEPRKAGEGGAPTEGGAVSGDGNAASGSGGGKAKR